MLLCHERFDGLHEFDLTGTGSFKWKDKAGSNFAAPSGTFFGQPGFNHQFVKAEVKPLFVPGKIKLKTHVFIVAVSGGDQMKGKPGENMVFAPVKVSISQQLQAVGVVHGHTFQALRQFPDVEGSFDLLYPGRIVPKDPVHPSINLK
jgi:hypothetical protein